MTASTTASVTAAGAACMTLVDDLQQAAAQAMDAAATAAAVLMPACQALGAALAGVAQAWAGNWVPGIGNLYQRDLQPLPRAEAFARVPPALMESCRVFTPQQVHDAVWQAAGRPDMQALQRASTAATGHFVQALCSLHLLLERAAAEHGDNGEIAALLLAASQVRLADKSGIAASWRTQHGGRPRQGGPFETTPAHISDMASVEALRSPLDGLLQVAGLLRRAVVHLQALPASAGTAMTAGTARLQAVRPASGQSCPTYQMPGAAHAEAGIHVH